MKRVNFYSVGYQIIISYLKDSPTYKANNVAMYKVYDANKAERTDQGLIWIDPDGEGHEHASYVENEIFKAAVHDHTVDLDDEPWFYISDEEMEFLLSK